MNQASAPPHPGLGAMPSTGTISSLNSPPIAVTLRARRRPLNQGASVRNEAEQRMSKSREESVSYQDRRETTDDLDRQYHKIGISALAAALRYQGDPPATQKTEDPLEGHFRAH